MTALIDLTGRTFGRWTVLKLSKERSSDGVLLWDCRCACGGKSAVCGASLRYGRSCSCGCFNLERIAERNRKSGPKLSRAHKSKERVVDDDGEVLFAPSAASHYTRKPYITLYQWSKRGCPSWAGRRVRRRLLRGGRGQEIAYFLKSDLDSVLAAEAQLTAAPAHTGLVPATAVCADLGLSEPALRHRLRVTFGRSGRFVKRLGRKKNGAPVGRRYVRVELVEQLRDRLDASVGPPEGRMVVKEAAAELGVSKTTVHHFAERWGLDLRRERTPAAVATSRGRPTRCTVSRAVVERLKRERAVRPPDAHDEGGGVRIMSDRREVGGIRTLPGMSLDDIGPLAIGKLGKLLTAISTAAAEDGYITSKEAAKLTALELYELSRLCHEGGPIRHRRRGQRLHIHAGDLARFLAERDKDNR